MELVQGVLALALAGLLLVLPGLAVLAALRPCAGWVRNTALAPAVSLGLAWLVATVLQGLALPVKAATLVPILAVVTLVAAGVARSATRSAPSGVPSEATRSTAVLLDRWERIGLAVAVAIPIVILMVSTASLSDVPPNDDGTHHGLFTARILATDSLDMSRLVVGDVVSGDPTSGFYPMALHVVAAAVAGAGLPVGVAVNAVWIVATSVGLVLGMFVLVRRTLPGRRWVALSACSFLAASQLAFRPLLWGGLVLVASMGQVPGLADALLGIRADAGRAARRAVALGVALGLAGVGIFFLHVTELITAVLLAGCLVLGLGRPHLPRDGRRQVLVVIAAAATVGLAALLPYARALLTLSSTAGEAVTPPQRDLGELPWSSLRHLLGSDEWAGFTYVLLALALLGLYVGARALRGWLLFAGAVSALVLAVAFGLPGHLVLSAPWYADTGRLGYNLGYVGAVLLGLGSVAVSGFLLRLLASRENRDAPARWQRATALALGVALPVALLAGESVAVATENYGARTGQPYAGSLAGTDPQEAWAWLAERVEPGERVLNQFVDGSGWMYAERGLAPLFALKIYRAEPWGDRITLLEGAADIRTDPDVSAAADRWNVRYAYVSDRLFPLHDDGTTRYLSVPDLIAGGWTVVFRNGTTTVLERPRT